MGQFLGLVGVGGGVGAYDVVGGGSVENLRVLAGHGGCWVLGVRCGM